MKGLINMRFEKAKKFFSVSMVVCMFTLAFGMMTAYAYSYLMFGGGFGLHGDNHSEEMGHDTGDKAGKRSYG